MITFPEGSVLLLFMSATIALNLTPGPDILYILSRSIAEGRDAGTFAVLGIMTGIVIHIAALTLGLSSLLASAPAAYETIRWAGAAYLIWLGIRSFLPAPRLSPDAKLTPRRGAVYTQGVFTALLNPKLAVFFLAFLPQFTDPSSPQAPQLLGLGVLFLCSGTLVNLGVSMASSAIAARLITRGVEDNTRKVLRLFTGTLFVLIGARLALSR